MSLRTALQVGSLAAVLLAGSCASPDEGYRVADPVVNHPITVEPSYASLKLPFSASDAGLLPDDAAKLQAFVADYLAHGNGALSISAPSGEEGNAAISYFGDRLTAMGVPPARILVGHHSESDERVELGYVTYHAKTDACGDWSESVADSDDNEPMPNFGCSVQHNIAAQVSDPRDLIEPRTMDAGDETRRTAVMGNYEKGQPTPATKGPDQSGAVSDVGR